MSGKLRSKMRDGISYLRKVVKSYSKPIVAACVVGLTLSSARADVLGYDAATGVVSWDFSDPFTVIMAGITLAIGLGSTIYAISRGWTLAKSLMR